MSSWIVTRPHIDVVVRGLCESEIVLADPTEVGRSLWRTNLDSVAYRYSELVSSRDRDDVEAYTYRRPPAVPHGWLLSAVVCLDYQSSERPDYEGTDAAHWLMDLRSKLDTAGVQADGPWGITQDDLAAGAYGQCHPVLVLRRRGAATRPDGDGKED